MASSEADREEDSNVLQVDGSHGNDTDEQADKIFHSVQTAATASSATTNISVSSESNLLVPGKLFSDITKLKDCYV